MSDPIFHRFLDLPIELQLHILSFAATPATTIRLTEDFLTNMERESRADGSFYFPFFHLTSRVWLPFMSWGTGVHGDRATTVATGKARMNLMAAYKLSRQVVLETWKKEVEDVVLTRKKPGKKNKREVIKFLKGLIEACQG